MPRCALVTGHDLVVVSGATRADGTTRTSFDTRLPSDPCAALDPVSPGSCAISADTPLVWVGNGPRTTLIGGDCSVEGVGVEDDTGVHSDVAAGEVIKADAGIVWRLGWCGTLRRS
jgi:hypothetical protein